MDKYSLAAVACICIAIIDAAALCNGIDGMVMTSCVAAIAAICAGTIGYYTNR